MQGSGQSLGGSPSIPTSPDDVRKRRLEALQGGSSQKLESSVISSSKSSEPSVMMRKTPEIQTSPFNLNEFHAVMWDSVITTEQDKNRWVNQGIGMREGSSESSSISNAPHDAPLLNSPEPASLPDASIPTTIIQNQSAEPGSIEKLNALKQSHGAWGLVQSHGGPCGVLAAIQAELLRLLWFTETTSQLALAHAMAEILVRVATTPPAGSEDPVAHPVVRIAQPDPSNAMWQDLLLSDAPNVITVHSIAKYGNDKWEDEVKDFVWQRLHTFHNTGGVLLLVMSLVATRTTEIVIQEFDDSIGTRLTGQFGHCAQELINLLLTGQAVSNVFDNTLSPSGDMVCRGIQARPTIGYLTQLEALRYCEVGSYYKTPKVPIWVVGSTSHFTVVFGELSSLNESQSDQILEECRRAFKSMEGGEENGFIPASKLGEILTTLNIDLGSDAEPKIQTLASSMEVGGGAGIILWDDFWKVAGRLMTGATVESILGSGTSTDPIMIDDMPDLVPAGKETDEEMARRLNAEWSNDGLSGLNALSSAAAAVSTPTDSMDVEPSPGMSDEEYARVLQAAFDSGNDFPASSSVGAIQGDETVADDLSNTVGPSPTIAEVENTSLLGDTETPVDMDMEDTKPPARKAHSFEEFGESFSMFHYNGLRGGILTPFHVTRLSSQEAIGSSVALNRGGTAVGGGSSQDLEDVVRTKWPSCNVDWLGARAPFID